MNYDTFFRFIFLDGMFDYFEMTQFNEFSDKGEIYFEEKNNPPEEYANDKQESKGFYEEVNKPVLIHLALLQGLCKYIIKVL